MARFTADYEESHRQRMDMVRALSMFGDDQFWDAIADVQDKGDDLVEVNEACFIMDTDWWPQTCFALKWKSTEIVPNPADPKIPERNVSIQFFFLNRNFEKRLEEMEVIGTDKSMDAMADKKHFRDSSGLTRIGRQ
ncbi:hypothetical protein FAUST_8393 [Fusarium austroamericanum]|uniref:Uncharacterized protein n=1 Tax=Fusarium austroamericanum TaxID=282268 RepID=A0AAN5Z4M3_FUSAU|nr:hypothetical protein FAUST_8393 [Fusarium austroamericanum]